MNVTTVPLMYVHVFPSALSVPTSDSAGRQLVADAAVVFQQLLPVRQAQSRLLPLDEDPPQPSAQTTETTSTPVDDRMTHENLDRESAQILHGRQGWSAGRREMVTASPPEAKRCSSTSRLRSTVP